MSKFKAGLVAIGAVAAMAIFAPAAQAAPCDGKDLEQPFLDWNDKAFYGLAPGGDFESGLDGWEVTGDGALAPGGNPFRERSSATALKLSDGDSVTTPPICVTKHNPSARIFGKTVDEGERNNTLQVEVLYLNDDGSVRKVKKAGSLKNEPVWDATRKFSLAQGQFNKGAKPDEDKPDKPEQADPKPEQDDPKPCEDLIAVAEDAKPCLDDVAGEPEAEEPAAEDKPSADDSHIQLRFTPRHGSTWKIDDIFVDPRRYS